MSQKEKVFFFPHNYRDPLMFQVSVRDFLSSKDEKTSDHYSTRHCQKDQPPLCVQNRHAMRLRFHTNNIIEYRIN